jgi:hypothetical protein
MAAEWHCTIMQPFFTNMGWTRCAKNANAGSSVGGFGGPCAMAHSRIDA